MANIEKSTIAKIPLSGVAEYTLDYTTDWGLVTKKIWNNKEVERYTFRLSNNEGILECGAKVAEKIMSEVNRIFNKFGIDVERVKDIKITIGTTENTVGVLVHFNLLPRKNFLSRAWNKVKRAFGDDSM